MNDYSHREIEKKWQFFWDKTETFYTDLSDKNKPKKYVLAMFPYPSGSGLHVGHVRNYTLSDALARFFRFQGFNVLMPIGWDAFGLPAEQYAIRTGNHPKFFTNKNIINFKKQLKSLGFSYDWSKEINTSNANYYRWTQWIFKQIYLQRLAVYEETSVFWCEELGTVLANEEIKIVDGERFSEQGGFPVVKRLIPQWTLKITEYAEELINGLEEVNWPNNIKALQINWIGKTKGFLINFDLVDSGEKLTIFTTSPNTIYGATAIAISINHPLLNLVKDEKKKSSLELFCKEWSSKFDNKKEALVFGEFTGLYCKNPVSEEVIPIWLANFVVPNFGTEAIMISPFPEEIFSNDSFLSTEKKLFSKKEILQNRKVDFLFAQKYNLLPKNNKFRIESGLIFHFNSPLIEGFSEKEKACEIIYNYLESSKKIMRHNNYHLKDWVFSRQRYWGEPIPVIHWNDGIKEILADDQLPLNLPNLAEFTPSKEYYSPLQKLKSWVNLKRADGIFGERDVNVMPQWAGSCWYYLAFLMKNKDKGEDFANPLFENTNSLINHWLPVDIYIGGQEHANLHLLYARFWHKVLKKIGFVKSNEPFKRLICQGMVLGLDGEKMSKSKGNVINPDDLIEEYGADSLRLYEMFLGPIEQTVSFDINGVKAMRKWLKKIYNFFLNYLNICKQGSIVEGSDDLDFYYSFIENVSNYYQQIKLNLVISTLMKFINDCQLRRITQIPNFVLLDFLIVLNPLAPHITEEIWSWFKKTDINISKWPFSQKNARRIEEKKGIPIQVNGRFIVNFSGVEFEEIDYDTLLKEPKIFLALKGRKFIKLLKSSSFVNFICEEI